MTDSSVPPEEDWEAFLGSLEEPVIVAGESFTPSTSTDFGDVTYDTDDTIETGFEEATIKIGDGECRVCGAPTFRPPGLTASGRKKRAPSYCDLHNPKRTISKDRSKSGGMDSQLQRVQEELADDLRLIAALAGPMLPVTGFYLFDRADAFTIALLKLAKNNQRMLRVMHRVAQVAPVYTIGETVAGVAYSIQVDTQRADPHTVVGQRLGVSKAYSQVYPEASEDVINNGMQPPFQGPPKYATA